MPIEPQTSAPIPQERWEVKPITLIQLSEEERRIALQRFEALAPHLESGVALADLAKHQHRNERTLRRWLASYRKHGLAGLSVRSRSDRGRFRLPDEMQKFVEGLALRRPPPSAMSIYRSLKPVAAAKQWAIPSYATIAKVVRYLPADMVTLAHDGSKAYADAFELLHRREAERPNEIWQADHTPLDILVLDDKDEAARPWFSAIMDDHSRVVTGWLLSLRAPSAMGTSLALRQAIWRKDDPRWSACGIPEVFYTDHGSDFTSSHLQHVSADLKMQTIFSGVGRPRGRGKIERLFQSINQMFLQDQPGYMGPTAAPAKAVLTMAQLEARLGEFIIVGYNHRLHPEIGTTPQAKWEAAGFLPRMPDSLEQLDLLLLTVARSRLVRRDGIYFQSLRYLDPVLASYVGEAVTIRYDPRDLTEIRVFFGGHFLCRAICQDLTSQTVSLNEIVRARRARKRQLQDEIQNRKRVVEMLMEARAGEAALVLPAAELPKPRLKRYIHDD